jgi:hypothetical protein
MSNLELTRRVACMAALVGALATTAPAHAIIIYGDAASSVGQTGSAFEAELTYSFVTPIAATLTIDLQNTTPPAVGGFLTAFVLNNPDNKISSVSLLLPPTNWSLLGLDSNNVNGAPFGQFDFGATTGNSFEGGGNPNLGFTPGTGDPFIFSFVGTDLDTLTAESFLGAFSVPPGAGGGTQFFAARFRGLASGGSDKVAAVPEPSTYAVLLAGVALVTWRLRRRPLG